MNYTKIPGGTDPSQQLAMINQNFATLQAENVTKLFKDANGVPNISIGLQPDGTSRIRIAFPGVDVTTATDDQLVFNSSQNTLKIVKTGRFNISAAANTTTSFSVAHGLGYIPIMLGYINTGSGYFPAPITFAHARDDVNQVITHGVYIESRIDATNIVVTFFNSLAVPVPVTGNYGFRYYLLQETAA